MPASNNRCCSIWHSASHFCWIFVRDKLLSHHILLAIACVLYILLGAWVFQLLEGQHLLEAKASHLRSIDENSDRYAEAVWAEIQANSGRYLGGDLTEEEAVAEIRVLTEKDFNKYVDTVYAAHRGVRHGFEENPPTWDFKNSLFFTATMLTSIGYGFVCPTTFEGRLFGVLYCLIGIPLTLVNVANVAKFFSEFIFFLHFKVWELWGRFRHIDRPSPDLSSPGVSDIFGDSEDEQSILDRVKLVRFPPFVVFGMVIAYGFLAAYIVQRYYELRWTYLESLYFMFISILTVGFGDYRPQPENMFAVLFLVTCGVIFTTMCMDVVGRMYLKEIHYLGRKLQSNNPFYMIREAKAKRRRAAMASLLAQLAKGMIFAHKNFSELQRKISIRKFSSRRRPSHILPDGKFMFARMPPDPPRECQVISTSAYSVRLAWTAAFSSSDVKVTYNVRYRQKYEQHSDGEEEGGNKLPKMRELKGIQSFAVEIMSLASCSLYEFRVTAVSKYGESKPVVLVQYTEPQLSPQHLLATKLSGNTVELTWEPPYKRTNDVKHYMVYWTDNPEARLSEWQKVTVYGRRIVFPELKHDWFYLYCANACFNNGQRSPLSRAIFVKTDKLELNKRCIGHSRTVEVMESIAQREEEASETTPLLRRAKCASFAV